MNQPAVLSPAVPWYRTVTREQWRVLAAAKFGWMLDAMDFMLYTVAVERLRPFSSTAVSRKGGSCDGSCVRLAGRLSTPGRVRARAPHAHAAQAIDMS